MNEENLQVVLDELQKDVIHPELIRDNKYPFTYNDNLYQVRMPTQIELTEANNARTIKFYELLKQKDECGKSIYLTIDNLKKLLKESQDIDINAMDMELEKLKEELIRVHADLAQKSDVENKAINEYKNKIQQLKNQRQSIILEKAGYLAPAIQMQAEDIYYKTLTRLCTEIFEEAEDKKNGKFIKVWNTISEYNSDNSFLPNIALGKFTELYFSI